MAGLRTFPKAARLRRRREFLSLQREGRRRHTAHLVVIRRAATGAISRVGITVSARVGNAVTRNRIKRFIREIFRSRRSELSPPHDIVIIAKPGAQTLSYAQVATEIAHALDWQNRR